MLLLLFFLNNKCGCTNGTYNIVKFQGKERKAGLVGGGLGVVVLFALGSTSKQETQHKIHKYHIYHLSHIISFSLYIKVSKENCCLLPVLKACKTLKIFY